MGGLKLKPPHTPPIPILIKCHLVLALSTLSKVCSSSSSIASFLSSLIDLIRHGKHHQNRHSTPDITRDLRQPPQNTVAHTPEAAHIPDEGREDDQKSTMPTYKGLERFKLDIKMGECVFYHLSIVFSPLLTLAFISSGAFSNVFKALEISTGKHVASMVSDYLFDLLFY